MKNETDMEEKGLLMAAGPTLNGPETTSEPVACVTATKIIEDECSNNTNSNRNQFE